MQNDLRQAVLSIINKDTDLDYDDILTISQWLLTLAKEQDHLHIMVGFVLKDHLTLACRADAESALHVTAKMQSTVSDVVRK